MAKKDKKKAKAQRALAQKAQRAQRAKSASTPHSEGGDGFGESSAPTKQQRRRGGHGAPADPANPNLIALGPGRRNTACDTSLSLREEKKEKLPSLDPIVVMAPAPPPPLTAPNGHPGPHPSFIELAKPYVFQQKLERFLATIGMSEAKEDGVRLQGVQLIDSVRKAVQLPVRTYNTAVVYYHKFRLVHSDNEYNFMEAALGALFTACKIEDTLKKSREIICASFNLKLPPAEHLTPDDPQLEQPSKVIIGLERLMLESAGFDFRNRHPQKLVIKLAKACGFAKENVGRTAYTMSLDLYRTFAPLKQTTPAMAIACVELSARLCGANMTLVTGEQGIDYARWRVSRAEVMETMMDLLDLYTHHRPNSLIGPSHSLDTFINVRLALNQEATAKNLPRYTETQPARPSATNGNGRAANGSGPGGVSPFAPQQQPISAIGSRGLGGTVRFMIDARRARDEKSSVAEFFKDEEEEYEVEVEVETPPRRGGR